MKTSDPRFNPGRTPPYNLFESYACASAPLVISTINMTRSLKSLLAGSLSLFVLSSAALLLSACSHPAMQQTTSIVEVPFPDGARPGDRRILAGEWEYVEEGVVVLTLDEQGNGPYAWMEGRIETQTLIGQTWQGKWFQKDNDREGGFTVEFLPDFSEGNGRWWYTRIGSDYAPVQEGGRFHLVRKSLSARVSAKPADP